MVSKLDDDPEEKLDRRMVVRLNTREMTALTFVALDMRLSRAEALRSLILTAYVDLKPAAAKQLKG